MTDCERCSYALEYLRMIEHRNCPVVTDTGAEIPMPLNKLEAKLKEAALTVLHQSITNEYPTTATKVCPTPPEPVWRP